MSTEITKELVKKRHAELICLGIVPKLFYASCKLLDRHITTVYKDGILYQFVNNNNKELAYEDKRRDSTDRRFPFTDAVYLIEETFGIESLTASNIVKEWRRDKMINAKMYERVSEYWRYISLPYDVDEE